HGHGAVTLQFLPQTDALHELHGQKVKHPARTEGVCPQVISTAHVRVTDAPSQLHFCHEAAYGAWAVADARCNRLQRDAFSEHAIVGLVNFAHAASGNEPLNTVAVG